MYIVHLVTIIIQIEDTAINFDTISDLYLDSMKDVEWQHKVTSLFCIVAGNISSNHDVVFDFLNHLSGLYRGVFFVDGDLEHKNCKGDYDGSYDSLANGIEEMSNVFFLHEKIVILDDVIVFGTNGWTTFNFTDEALIDANINLLVHKGDLTDANARKMFNLTVTDQSYLHNSIMTSKDIQESPNMLIVTNCVPRYELIEQDLDYKDSILGDLVGSLGIHKCLDSNTKNKSITWMFGRYPVAIDKTLDGVRYVSNPATNKDYDIYYPKIIKF